MPSFFVVLDVSQQALASVTAHVFSGGT